MRLCVALPCFFKPEDFLTAIPKIKALSYDAVEIYGLDGIDLNAFCKACEENEVELLSICTSEFRMTQPQYRRLWLDGLKQSCENAKLLGAKRLITQVGPNTGEEREKQRESIIAALREALPILKDSGMTLMIEPLNTIVNHKGYFLSSSSEAFDIVKEINSPFVKVIFDIYHQQITEGNIISNIRENIDLIAHFHAAGNPGRNELQYGENDYKVIFDAIDKLGKTATCGLEYNPLLEPIESLKKARELYG